MITSDSSSSSSPSRRAVAAHELEHRSKTSWKRSSSPASTAATASLSSSLSRSASSSGSRYWPSVAIRTITPGAPAAGGVRRLARRRRARRGAARALAELGLHAARGRRRPRCWRSARAAGGRCRPGPGVSVRLSSNAPAASSSSIALARARMFSVLSTARCIAMPTSAISSPTPVAASEILHLGLGGGVLRLDDLLLGAELVDLGAQLLLLVDQLLLLRLELRDLLVERLQLGLGELLALERDAREVLAALRRAPGGPACRA